MAPGTLTRIASVVAALVVSGAGPARAQALSGFELERLELNPGAQGSLLLSTGRLLPEGALRVSVTGHYERTPLALYSDTQALQAFIRDRSTTHLGVAYAPLSWLELGMQVPFVVHQAAATLDERAVAAPASAGLSTPHLSARLGVFTERDEGRPDLALELDLGLPVGSAAVLGREAGLRYTPRVTVGRRMGAFRIGFDASALLRPPSTLSPETSPVKDEIGSEVRVGAALATTGDGVRWELNLLTAISLTNAPNAAEALTGVRVPLGTSWELFTLGGIGFGARPGTPLFRVLAGVAFDTSRTRAERPVPPLLVATRIEPPPEPPPAPPPVPAPREEAEVPRPPDPPKDTDGDGVPDERDTCPNDPGVPENAGCPAQRKNLVVLTRAKLEIFDKVYFETGKAVIRPRSFPLLDEVAKVIREHPEIPAVRVEGHTDIVSSAAFNLRLSQRRAEAVREYLIGKGVEPERLVAEGFGYQRPADTNATSHGRERNRRVEFIILLTPPSGSTDVRR